MFRVNGRTAVVTRFSCDRQFGRSMQIFLKLGLMLRGDEWELFDVSCGKRVNSGEVEVCREKEYGRQESERTFVCLFLLQERFRIVTMLEPRKIYRTYGKMMFLGG